MTLPYALRRKIHRSSGSSGGEEEEVLVSSQRAVENHAQNTAGQNFADTYGQHHEWNGERGSVGEAQHERYDDCVREDWRKRRQYWGVIAKLISTERPDQGSDTSEDNIREYGSA